MMIFSVNTIKQIIIEIIIIRRCGLEWVVYLKL